MKNKNQLNASNSDLEAREMLAVTASGLADYQKFKVDKPIGNVKQGDIVNLNYDFAPDSDDGLASGLGKILTDKAEIKPYVVAGAVGPGNQLDDNRSFNVKVHGDDGYRVSSNGVNTKQLLDKTFGNGEWVQAVKLFQTDANGKPTGQGITPDKVDPDKDIAVIQPEAIKRTADLYSATLSKSKSVHVADGGPSDFTHDVLQDIIKNTPEGPERTKIQADIKKGVNVYQHSKINRGWTNKAKYDWLQQNSNYINLPDGNRTSPNPDAFQGFKDLPDPDKLDFFGTGNVNSFDQKKDSFISDSFKYSGKTDGSDVAELVYALGQQNNLKTTADIGKLSQGTKNLTGTGPAQAAPEPAPTPAPTTPAPA